MCIINIVAALHPHRSRTLTDSGLWPIPADAAEIDRA
jgi:hypothetical protein